MLITVLFNSCQSLFIVMSVLCCTLTVSTLHGTLCLVRALIWPFGSSIYIQMSLLFVCLCLFVFVLVSACHIVFN